MEQDPARGEGEVFQCFEPFFTTKKTGEGPGVFALADRNGIFSKAR